MLTIKKLLKEYEIVKLLKESTDNKAFVLLLKKNEKQYVAKFIHVEKIEHKLMKKINSTEVQAYKFIEKYFRNYPFFPKFCTDIFHSHVEGLVIEYVKGEQLYTFKKKDMPEIWWRSLILQLVIVSYLFESHKILHNDFWDANIIISDEPIKNIIPLPELPFDIQVPNAGFVIKVIDFEFANQYNENPEITSPMVLSTDKRDKEEKSRLGWSSKWHTGSDLNQILGILAEYKSIPIRFKEYILNNVNTKEGSFKYATKLPNIAFNPKFLLMNFDQLFIK